MLKQKWILSSSPVFNLYKFQKHRTKVPIWASDEAIQRKIPHVVGLNKQGDPCSALEVLCLSADISEREEKIKKKRKDESRTHVMCYQSIINP